MGLNVVALTEGELSGTNLWLLRHLDRAGHQLTVVRSQGVSTVSAWRRFRRLARDYGWLHPISRRLGQWLFGARAARRAQKLHDYLVDRPFLEQWYRSADLPEIHVPHLNHELSRAAVEKANPDVIIRIGGGLLKRKIFSLSKRVTLNLHHGRAPAIRGMSSIFWGIVEGRPDWIGATIHQIDDGIDTGPVYWRGSPQLAPGDRGETLHFRITIEAADALLKILETLRCGEELPVLSYEGESVYRTAPGLRDWICYLLLRRRGRRSRILLERALL